MALSLRLALISALVPPGARVCDIGTDHGYLPIELIKRGDIKSVIATDIRKMPLASAEKNIKAAGVGGITLRLCNGLEGIAQNEVDTVITAGMGGEVIASILARSAIPTASPAPLLILQPTTSPEFLRQFLCENGFEIISDTALCENAKLYSVITARYTGERYNFGEEFYYCGRVDPRTEDGAKYIEKQYSRLKKCADALENIPEKREEYTRLAEISAALKKKLTENRNGI